MDNWKKMRSEYIKGGISYRALAAKYGVSNRTICDRGKAEHWVELREQARVKSVAKTVEKIAEQNARVDERIYGIAGRLMDKLEKAVEELDAVEEIVAITEKTDTSEKTTKFARVRSGEQGTVDRLGIKQITNALRDLKAIMDVKSSLDEEEQRARIEKLRKDAAQEQTTGSVTVVLDGDINEFAG